MPLAQTNASPSPVRDLELRALDSMRAIDVTPDSGWKDFIACSLMAGLSIQSIAEALPCAPSTVSRWHSGKSAPPQFAREPTKTLLIRLAEKHLA